MKTGNDTISVQDFISRVGNNSGKNAVKVFVEELEKEGVLSLFIDKDKIQELNSVLECRIPKPGVIINDKTYLDTFTYAIMTAATAYLYGRSKNEVTEPLIKVSIEFFIDNTRWAEVFESFCCMSNMAVAYEYKKHIEAYKASGANEGDVKEVEELYKASLPTGMRYNAPTTKYGEGKDDVLNQFDLLGYFDSQYIDDVFASIEHLIKEKFHPDSRYAIHELAKGAVERLLFAQAVDELHISEKEATPEQMREWMTKVKAERKVYIMAMYYLMCLNILAFNK